MIVAAIGTVAAKQRLAVLDDLDICPLSRHQGLANISVAKGDPLLIAVRLGLLAWALQGFVEFGLYIPALAWPAWLMLGWLLASPTNWFDKSAATE